MRNESQPIREQNKFRLNRVIKSTRSKISLSLVLVILLSGLFLLYGPYSGFRVFLITTSMNTANHKCIANALYSKGTIKRVMDENVVVEPDDKTDPERISEDGLSNAIELTEIEKENCTGVLLRISDPSRVSVAYSKDSKGMLLEKIAEDTGGIAAINASGYLRVEEPGIPTGILISDSKIIHSGFPGEHSIIGFDKENKFVIGNYADDEIASLRLRDAVEFGPLLIINGTKSQILGNGGGYAPRSAIGQTKTGEVLFLCLDGRTLTNPGASLIDVQDILYEYGAINAANLDGGSSVSMYYEGKIVNNATSLQKHRIIPCCFVVR